jgi:hypothetical protein
MSDNSGTTKTTRKMEVGPWQQGNNNGGYDDRGDKGPPPSPADGEDDNTAAGEDQGDATSEDVHGGDADAGKSSVNLAASNPTTTTTPMTMRPMPKTQPGRRP